jgi:hypothetical protein
VGESGDILGDRFLNKIRGDRCLMLLVVEGRSLVWWKYGYFRRALCDEIRGDRCLALLVC